VGNDPEAGKAFTKAMATHGPKVKVVDREYDALDGAHALVLLTEWRSYRAPNFTEIRKRLQPGRDGAVPTVIDARNVWRPWEVMAAGLRYMGIGVPSVQVAPARTSTTTLT
jgi:UDPglucose 6-dehydrogenase